MIISDFKPIIFSFVCSNLTNYIPSYLSFLALKGKKKLEKVKNKSRSGRPDCRSNITDVDKSKKRPAQPSKFDLPNKRSKKEESHVPYGKKCSGGRKAKKNRSHLNKSVGHSSSVCIDNMDKNHATLQKNSHIARLNKGPSSTGGYAQFEGRCMTPVAHVDESHGNFAVVQHPSIERPYLLPPLREVANILFPHPGGSHPNALFNTTVGFQHQNGAIAGPHAPAYVRGIRPNQQRVAFSSPNISQTVYRSVPEAANVVPHFRYPNGSTGFRR